MRRKRFTESQVLETLAWQGFNIVCCRCSEPLFVYDAKSNSPQIVALDKIEREHLHEVALGGADEPKNCRYSHAKCHARITNGTKATSAGSSKQRIAKVKRIIRKRENPKPKRKMPPRPFQKGKRKMRRARTDNTKHIERQ